MSQMPINSLMGSSPVRELLQNSLDAEHEAVGYDKVLSKS